MMETLAERYEIRKLLGKKAGRHTFLAIDLTSQEPVIIKLLSLGIDFNWQDFKLFEREARVLKSLNHPAIPRYLNYLELSTTQGYQFALVQQYVHGKTLDAHLKAGRNFSETDVKRLAASLLKVLIYLHSQSPSVIHRDIKPSNIILGDRTDNQIEPIYLVDFGSVTNIAATEGATITVTGTYGYMPPEQFGGRAVPVSDLYSLGATLIYLITGMHPTELPQSNLKIQFRQLTSCDLAFVDWLNWLVEPSIDKRPSSAQDALRNLGQLKRFANRATVFEKPYDSEIQIDRGTETLTILLPQRGINLEVVATLAALLTSWIFAILVILGEGGPNQWGVQVVLAPVITLLTGRMLMESWQRIRLHLSSTHVMLTRKLFGYRLNQLGINTLDHIELITDKKTVVPNTMLQISSAPLQLKKSYVDHKKSRLTICSRRITGSAKNKSITIDRFELDKMSTLTRRETHWLAYEIRNWLDTYCTIANDDIKGDRP
ncbi:MAG: serine/threonine protein kinase [Elainellaceae cyanobacterium]